MVFVNLTVNDVNLIENREEQIKFDLNYYCNKNVV